MISIIIVNYNTPDLTLQAVMSCERYLVDVDYEIILVDNASTKGCLESVLKNVAAIQIIKSKENIGFGRANNLGFENAKGDYIFLLNSDAFLIDQTSVPLMIHYLETNKSTAIVGPSFIKEDGSKNYAYGNLLGARKMLHESGLWKIPKEKWGDYATYKVCDYEEPQKVGYLAAAGIIIKRQIIEKHGLFDPNFFLYFEDMELGWRYEKAGFKSVLLPKATIMHLGGGSSGTISSEIAAHILKSKKYYIKKTQGRLKYHFFLRYDKFKVILNRIKKSL